MVLNLPRVSENDNMILLQNEDLFLSLATWRETSTTTKWRLFSYHHVTWRGPSTTTKCSWKRLDFVFAFKCQTTIPNNCSKHNCSFRRLFTFQWYDTLKPFLNHCPTLYTSNRRISFCASFTFSECHFTRIAKRVAASKVFLNRLINLKIKS